MRAASFAIVFALTFFAGYGAVLAADKEPVPAALASLPQAERDRILRYQDKNFQSALSTCMLEALSAGKIGVAPLEREDFIFDAEKKRRADQCIKSKGYDASDIVTAIPEGVPQADLQDFNARSAEIERLQQEALMLTQREEMARQMTAARKPVPVPEEYRSYAGEGAARGAGSSSVPEMKIFKYNNGEKTKTPAGGGNSPKPLWNPQ